MEFRTYLVRRLLLLIPVLIGVTFLIFLLLHFFSPAQRAMLYVHSPQQMRNLDEIIAKYGLNAPIWKQYWTWLVQVFHGNLGWSQVVGMPVTSAIASFLPATLELAIFATPLIIFSVSYGHKSRRKQRSLRGPYNQGWGYCGLVFTHILVRFNAVNDILWVSFSGFLPPERLGNAMSAVVHSSSFIRYTGLNFLDGILNWRWDVTLDALRHLVLPVVTLTVVNTAFIMRLMRSSMLETLGKGYVLTARAKGLPESTVINKHARRNAMIPILTISGYLFASIVKWSSLLRKVFLTTKVLAGGLGKPLSILTSPPFWLLLCSVPSCSW